MNVENIRALAARLRAPATQGHFNMGMFLSFIDKPTNLARDIHTCGTTACIAGYAVLLAEPTLMVRDQGPFCDDYCEGDYAPSNSHRGPLWVKAADWLGIDDDAAEKLFVSHTSASTTPEQAAQVLDHLIETGNVNWDILQ
jgi:hypothetical protein